jgi:hypothetical protein
MFYNSFFFSLIQATPSPIRSNWWAFTAQQLASKLMNSPFSFQVGSHLQKSSWSEHGKSTSLQAGQRRDYAGCCLSLSAQQN